MEDFQHSILKLMVESRYKFLLGTQLHNSKRAHEMNGDFFKRTITEFSAVATSDQQLIAARRACASFDRIIF